LNSVTDSALADMAKDSDLFACIVVNPFAMATGPASALHVGDAADADGGRCCVSTARLEGALHRWPDSRLGLLKIDKRRVRGGKQNAVDDRFLDITPHPGACST